MTNEESTRIVLLRGTRVEKSQVPLGKEYVEDGRTYQGYLDQGTYKMVVLGGRFRYGDQWFQRVDNADPMPLEPNMPFGKPYFRRNQRGFQGGERVSILRVEDRGPAQT